MPPQLGIRLLSSWVHHQICKSWNAWMLISLYLFSNMITCSIQAVYFFFPAVQRCPRIHGVCPRIGTRPTCLCVRILSGLMLCSLASHFAHSPLRWLNSRVCFCARAYNLESFTWRLVNFHQHGCQQCRMKTPLFLLKLQLLGVNCRPIDYSVWRLLCCMKQSVCPSPMEELANKVDGTF